MKSEQERLHVAERRLKVEAERDAAIKAFEEEKANRKASEERIKKEAYELAKAEATQEIVDYGMSFRPPVLFMSRQKYPDLDLSDIDLIEIKGQDKLNSTDGFDRQKDEDIEGDITVDQVGEWEDIEEKM